METLEELVGGPKDHAHIIKGKRTKRQRLQSPIPFSIATPNSSSGDGDNNYSSNEFAESGTTEEEEEDMVANCLILLAQGQSIDPKSSNPGNPRDHGNRTGFRYTSKRFLEAPSTMGGGKVGMFVYQCKTCDRSFPSFQALGGHRASHKRLKPAPVEVKRKKMLLLSDDDEEEGGEIKDHISSSLSLQLINRPNCLPKASAKVHECSVCGAEFVSGQALGGHMRCHRASGGTNTTLSLSPLSPIGLEYENREAKKQRAVFSLSPIGCEHEDQEAKKQRSLLSLSPIGCEYEDREAKKQRGVLSLSPVVGESEDQEQAKKQRILVSLDLDLNLPAPVEDQVEESKYAFASKQQPPQQQQQQQQLQPQKQSPLVLPTASTLVDCQY